MSEIEIFREFRCILARTCPRTTDLRASSTVLKSENPTLSEPQRLIPRYEIKLVQRKRGPQLVWSGPPLIFVDSF